MVERHRLEVLDALAEMRSRFFGRQIQKVDGACGQEKACNGKTYPSQPIHSAQGIRKF